MYLFGDLRSRDECDDEGMNYDESVHKLRENEINKDIL